MNIAAIIFITIIVTRLWLRLMPISSPKMGGFKLHHYVYGIVISIVGLAMSNTYLLGIGLGLFIDELPLLLRYKNNDFHWKEYNSLYSRVGVAACLLVVWAIWFLY